MSPSFIRWRISRNAVSAVNMIAADSTERDGSSSPPAQEVAAGIQNDSAGTP